MKILTVSSSPYILSKLGKINASLLDEFSKGHSVASLCWDHDPSYFMPEDMENPRFFYTRDGNDLCEIFPISRLPEQAVVSAFEIMKSFQPDVVITIGDYHETAWMHAIKQAYPQLFKWIAILTINSLPMNGDFTDAISIADRIVVTNESSRSIWKEGMPEIEVHKFGPSGSFFASMDNSMFRVMASCKNSQSANCAAFIQSVSGFLDGNNAEAYLHTNINDIGDYDIDELIERFGKGDYVDLPSKFVSINEGIPERDLAIEYAKSSVFVDLSVQSATGLSVLEAMSCGCVPVVSGANGLKEIVEQIGCDGLLVKSVEFVGDRGEVLYLADPDDAESKLRQLYILWEHRIKEFEEISSKCRDIAKRYSQDTFVKGIKGVVDSVIEQPRMKLAVETISK